MAPKQVIVVDDGSTDDTLTRLRDYGDAICLIEGHGEGERGSQPRRWSGESPGSPSLIPMTSGSQRN